MRSTMQSLSQRIDTTNVRIMGSILAAHRESGGNLAETLQRLSEVIRNRFDYQQKLRAVTGTGRTSLAVVITLAWGIFAYLFIFQPEYGRNFWVEPSGKTMLVVAFVLEVLGMLWALALLKNDL